MFELSPTDLILGDFPQCDVLAHLTEHDVEAEYLILGPGHPALSSVLSFLLPL